MNTRGRRLVLDSCCFKGAALSQLEALREGGFRISISELALSEVWANAARNEKLQGLAARARNLSSYVDQADPVVPTNVDLVARLGGKISGTWFRQPDASFEVGIREVWRRLGQGELSAQELRGSGLEVNAQFDELSRGWVATSNRVDPDVRESVANLPEVVAVRRVASWLVDNVGRDLSLQHGVQERLHGYFRIVALHAVRAAAKTHRQTTENDSEDVQLLMHLADDVILVTSDFDLVGRVDDSGSFQAPYVMTIGELLNQPAPEGPPWGKTARRAAKSHVRRHRKRLNELDQTGRSK